MFNLKKRMIGTVAVLVFAAVFGIAGCSDSDSPTSTGNGNADTTPPEIVSVTAVDAQHVDVEFSEPMRRATAERSDYYTIVVATPAAYGTSVPIPSDTVHVNGAALDDDGITVHLSTSEWMQNVVYDIYADNVTDMAGNAIASRSTMQFTGTSDADVTPPTITYREPAPGATGMGVGQSVLVQFSEGMDYGSVMSAFSLTHGGGTVACEVDSDYGTYLFSPQFPLSYGTTYTVTISGTAEDWAGNALATTSWSFTTTNQVDTTPPQLVSSSPSNGAANVGVSATLSLTFSEAVDPYSLEDVMIVPDLGDGVPEWTNGGRTVVFDPFEDMLDDTQYILTIIPGDLRDLAGNGNSDPIVLTWTTGSTLESGSFSGTISGPGSADAPDAEGALVIASDVLPFGEGDDGPTVIATGVVGTGGNYTVGNVPDGSYYPVAALDSNGDGEIDPSLGDAMGLYGFDFETMSGDPTAVVISGGNSVGGVDFSMFDPTAIAGTITYDGAAGCCYALYVGVFASAGFDPENPGDPLFGTEAWWPDYTEWSMSEFDEIAIPPGSYVVGAFLDLDDDGSPDPGEPMGIYGGETPTAVTVGNGSDAVGLTIELHDAVVLSGSWDSVTSREHARPAVLEGALRILRDAR